MNNDKRQKEWPKYLRFFSEQNAGRPTRLGVFERNGDTVNDYWLENGLLLAGIDVDTKRRRPSVQIMVGELNHVVNDAVKLVFHFSLSGDEDGLGISTAEGQTTVLRFETQGK